MWRGPGGTVHFLRPIPQSAVYGVPGIPAAANAYASEHSSSQVKAGKSMADTEEFALGIL
jgi:hypothetical protein